MEDYSEEIATYSGSKEAERMLAIVCESDLPSLLRLPSLLALAVWAVNKLEAFGLDNSEAEEALGTLLLSPRRAVRILLYCLPVSRRSPLVLH